MGMCWLPGLLPACSAGLRSALPGLATGAADHLEAGRALRARTPCLQPGVSLGAGNPHRPLFALRLRHLSPYVVVTWVSLWVVVILTKQLFMQVTVSLKKHPG